MNQQKPPLTVEEIIREILGNKTAGSKSNGKSFDVLTVSRMNHLIELVESEASTRENFELAYNKLNASAWLKKPAIEITQEELEKLLEDAPWNNPAYMKKLKAAQKDKEDPYGLEWTGHLFKR